MKKYRRLIICFAVMNIFSHGLSFNNLVVLPFVQLIKASHGIVTSLISLTSPAQLSGIIGVVSQGGYFIKGNILNGLQFLGLISINFALLNLLPIPVLDGGKILLFSMEKIHVKFIRLHYPLAICGWVLILGLMLYVSFLDIIKLTA